MIPTFGAYWIDHCSSLFCFSFCIFHPSTIPMVSILLNRSLSISHFLSSISRFTQIHHSLGRGLVPPHSPRPNPGYPVCPVVAVVLPVVVVPHALYGSVSLLRQLPVLSYQNPHPLFPMPVPVGFCVLVARGVGPPVVVVVAEDHVVRLLAGL